jgi:hypothetical protein
MLVGGHQVVFEGCFQNTNEGHMVSRLSDEIGHRLWLQDPLNHLGGEQPGNLHCYNASSNSRVLHV